MAGEPDPFLEARWLDLGLVTYRIPADLIAQRLPPQLEPDRLPGDPEGVAYVSLVAFDFQDTRVKGVAVPLHTNFPEVNLRTYVREREAGGRRGVLFISEIVPKPAIAMVANLLYHEHYRALPMRFAADTTERDGVVLRRMHCEIELADRVHRIGLTGGLPPVACREGSTERFFKEHTWGFGVHPEGGLVTYRVDHPIWLLYPTSLDALELDVDFAELYGHPWGILGDLRPFHVAYAVGSEVAVYPRS